MKIIETALVLVIFALLVGCISPPAYAVELPVSLVNDIREGAPQTESEVPAPPNGDDYGAYKIQEEVSRRTLILALIGAGIMSLVIVLLFLKLIGTREPAIIVNASGLVLVIYATILVVMIAKAEQQLTAAIGILGAIAGYLFGAVTKLGAGADTSQKSDVTK